MSTSSPYRDLLKQFFQLENISFKHDEIDQVPEKICALYFRFPELIGEGGTEFSLHSVEPYIYCQLPYILYTACFINVSSDVIDDMMHLFDIDTSYENINNILSVIASNSIYNVNERMNPAFIRLLDWLPLKKIHYSYLCTTLNESQVNHFKFYTRAHKSILDHISVCDTKQLYEYILESVHERHMEKINAKQQLKNTILPENIVLHTIDFI